MNRKISSLWIGLGFLSSLSLAQGWRGAEAVALQVNDAKGRPVSGARVAFTFQGIPGELGPDIVATDSKGRAVVAELKPGPWQVEIVHPDYLSFIAMIDVRRGKKPLISASFLEAGGRSLNPVKVKISKGDERQASPVLEARATPAEPETMTIQEEEQAPVQVAQAPAPTPAPREPSPTPMAPPPRPESEPADEPPMIPAEAPAGGEDTGLIEETETIEDSMAVPVMESPAAPEPVPTPEPEEPVEASVPTPTAPAAVPAAESVEADVIDEVVVEAAEEDASAPSPTPVSPIRSDSPEPTTPSTPTAVSAETEPLQQVEPESVEIQVASPAEVPEGTPAMDELGEEVAAAIEAPAPSAPEVPKPTPPLAAIGALAAPVDPGVQVTSHRDGSCADCASAEWTLEVSAAVPAARSDSTGTCDAAILETARPAMQELAASIQLELEGFIGPISNGSAQEALRRAEASMVAPFEGPLAAFVGGASPCQVVGLVLPREVRFSRVTYAAADGQGSGTCIPGRDCAIGDAAWLGTARVERGPSSTVIYGLFENRSSEKGRRAFMTAYYRPPNARWEPRLPAGE